MPYIYFFLMMLSTKNTINGATAPTGLGLLASTLSKTAAPTLGFTTKGALQHFLDKSSDLEDLLLCISSANHGTDGRYKTDILKSIEKIRLAANIMSTQEKNELKELLFRMVCYLRDARKEGFGKGSRDPSYFLYLQLVENFPEWGDDLRDLLFPFVLKYGSQGDLPRLFSHLTKGHHVTKWIVDFFTDLMVAMESQMEDGGVPVTLTAKYLPREGKQYWALGKLIALEFSKRKGFDRRSAFKTYRKLAARANKLISTTEVMMCNGKFGDIKFQKVPGRCLAKNRLAWQNRTKSGVERSDAKDRKVCAENYDQFLADISKPDAKVGAKGTSLFITEIAGKLMKGPGLADRKLFEAQFFDHVKNLRLAAMENGMDFDEFLGNFVVLADFSGSMTGVPMDTACALALLVSSMSKGPFKDKFLSFESKPRFVDLSDCDTLTKKAVKCQNSPWGGSTNFESAHDLILDALKTHYESNKDNMSSNELNTLIRSMLPKAFLVVSDMQFDAAAGMGYRSSSSHSKYLPMHDKLVEKYARKGIELTGVPFDLPTMVYWNASPGQGSPVVSSTTGAVFVSGYSTNLFKTFMTSGIDGLKKFTPWSFLHQTLMNKWYDDSTQGRFPLATKGLMK